MSPDIKLVQELYAAFGRGEIAPIVDAMAPNVTWELNGRRQHHPILGKRSGPDEVSEFFRTLDGTLEFRSFSPREFYAADGKVFVIGHYSYASKQTGRTGDSGWIHIWTIRDGKVHGFLDFLDTAQLAEVHR